jgi:glutaredoxin 3
MKRAGRITPTPSRPVERAHRVLVFTTPSCPWCVRAKQYLRQRNVRFREVDVSRDPAAARDLVRRTGQMGVPVIEIDGRPIVGFDKSQIDRLLRHAA